MDRKLTTIFASDVVGFSKMMGMDEVNTLKILQERRETIETFKTIKILNWHLFYLAAIYAEKDDKELAKEKLKEAKAVAERILISLLIPSLILRKSYLRL